MSNNFRSCVFILFRQTQNLTSNTCIGTLMKSTQWTNFQSVAYFAFLFMKLTLIYVKVVKYFPF